MNEPRSTACVLVGCDEHLARQRERRLLREAYEPRDLFNEAKSLLNPVDGTLSVDDTVLDKPYSRKMALVGYFWSGKHHAVVKGLSLLTLYCTDPQRRSLPVNYRVYDKAEKKTMNDYFQDRLEEDWPGEFGRLS